MTKTSYSRQSQCSLPLHFISLLSLQYLTTSSIKLFSSYNNRIGNHLFYKLTSIASKVYTMAQKEANYSYKAACELLDSQKFTDFVIRCDDQDFHVHRLIIYHKSEYFRAIFDNNFREKSEGIVELKETTPAAVATVILYCYTNHFAATPIEESGDTPLARLVTPTAVGSSDHRSYMHAMLHVYQLADRLLLQDLKKEACVAMLAFIDDKRVSDEDFDAKLTVCLRILYRRMDTGDDMLRPAVTGWVAANFGTQKPAWNVVALVLKEDNQPYIAALVAARSRTRLVAKVVSEMF